MTAKGILAGSLMSKLTKLLRNPSTFVRDALVNNPARRGRLWNGVYSAVRTLATDSEKATLSQQRDANSTHSKSAPPSVQERALGQYTALVDTAELRPKTILYESFHGSTMSCSPLAIFLHLVKDPAFADYQHIWALNDRLACTVGRELLDRVTFVEVNSPEYVECLCTSEYLINNTSFPPYFLRRPGQRYLNTWHGTPWKTLGRDMQGALGQHQNIQRNLLQTTHLLSPNAFTTKTLLECHDLDGLYPGSLLEIGYPRIDVTLSADVAAVRHRLGIRSKKPIVLVAPTWRGEVGRVNAATSPLVSLLSDLCEELGRTHEIVFRGHVLEQKLLRKRSLPCKIVPDCVDTNELLAAVDHLITDYSSIFFDYLVTPKPVYLFIPDIEDYRHDRGLYFSADELPAFQCSTLPALVDRLRHGNWQRDFSDKYQSFRDKYLSLDDGRATLRLVAAFFPEPDETSAADTLPTDETADNSSETTENPQAETSGALTAPTPPRKKNLIFYCGGFLNNGVTTSAINLLNSLDTDRYNVIVVEGAENTAERKQNIEKLSRQVKILFRAGSCLTPEDERSALASYYATGRPSGDEEALLRRHFSRERRRLWADVETDIVVDFSGYVKFWTLLFALGTDARKVIYQHNDMVAENNKVVGGKYKHRHNFRVIFDAYRFFHRIVSVSEGTMFLNRSGLRSFVDARVGTFDYVTNVLNHEQIHGLAAQELEHQLGSRKVWHDSLRTTEEGGVLKYHEVPDPQTINFLHVGRFSPEKRHDKLLQAFRLTRDRRPATKMKLYLAGEGPLFQEIRSLSKQLGLADSVVFTGQLENPYWLMKRCSCVVLASDHEGQPMVLLEALILGIPVIATDIVGSRSVLGTYGGTLVPNTVEGLADGMVDLVTKGGQPVNFNIHDYRNTALARFYSVVCGE